MIKYGPPTKLDHVEFTQPRTLEQLSLEIDRQINIHGKGCLARFHARKSKGTISLFLYPEAKNEKLPSKKDETAG